MKLLITKTWHWRDIWLLKWCAMMLGLAAGAWLHELLLPHVHWILLIALLLAIRPAVAYWKN